MAKFLTTSGVTYNLERLMKEANEKLYLVSPFLKVNDRLRQLLEDRDRFKIDIRVVYGKAELQSEESTWLNSLDSLRLSYCKNLHAKCFLNESEALLTSMNLYEFSQINNEEMGILISRADDPSLYGEISDEIMRLIRISEPVRVTVEKVEPDGKTPKSKSNSTKRPEAPLEGYCIRCGSSMKANPMRPYCRKCFDVWNQYSNPEYSEKSCHLCGKENPSTLNKPTCYSCYRKFKNNFEFAIGSTK